MEELVRADLTMQEMQIQQWARIAAHPPRGAHIPEGILEDFGRNQYLSLKEAELTLYVKPRAVRGFRARFRLALRVLRGKTLFREQPPYDYDMCTSQEEGAVAMKLVVNKLDSGKIKATYHPADQQTEGLKQEH